MPVPRRSTRWLAPLAIVAVAIAGYSIASGGSADDSDGGATSKKKTTTSRTDRPATSRERKPRSYTVRSGDTLSAISLDTDISVGQIQKLNPDVDVQALQPGQRLKIRP